jgi:hypothetical protein
LLLLGLILVDVFALQTTLQAYDSRSNLLIFSLLFRQQRAKIEAKVMHFFIIAKFFDIFLLLKITLTH